LLLGPNDITSSDDHSCPYNNALPNYYACTDNHPLPHYHTRPHDYPLPDNNTAHVRIFCLPEANGVEA
jgi:hypothetical protein